MQLIVFSWQIAADSVQHKNRDVKSEFTFGLIVVMSALLLYAVTSNPLVQYIFSYRGFGQGPFVMLPDIFTTIALSVLLYLSMK